MTNNFENWKFPYDVLEPIKTPIDPHRAVGILIDINNEDTKLSGSDLDNIRKSTFGLIDLYENIYVTPQLIKKEEKVETLEIDDEFFCRTEEDSNTSKDLPLNTTDDIDSIIKCDNNQSNEKPLNQIILNNLDIPRVLKVPTVNLKQEDVKRNLDNPINKDQGIHKTENYQKITTNENITNIVLTKINPTNATDKSFNNDIASILKTFKNIDLKNVTNQCHHISLNSRSVTNRPMIYQGREPLKTIALDKKTYGKRQIRSEIEKLRLTKGPDLYEKSIVLPQIMKRITERNIALQEDLNLKRRLVLDTKTSVDQCHCKGNRSTKDNSTNTSNSSKSKEVQTNTNENDYVAKTSSNIMLSPIIALENCNRERLIAHKVQSAFEKYVLTGSYY